MTEIKPVYQYKTGGMLINYWQDVDEEIFLKINKDHCYTTRIIYLAADYEALQKENAELKEDLQFVERWANHHGTKPNVTAQEALSCIQHYPSIAAITKSYKDGVIPNTRNPYAEIESLRKRVEELSQPIQDWKIELLFNRAMDYKELRISEAAYDKAVREILSASKNGE